MTLVEKITTLCHKNGLTIASLQSQLGFSNSSIRKWDVSPPAGARLAKVAQFFGVSVEYLLGQTENPYSHKQLDDFRPSTIRLIEVSEKMDLSPEATELAIEILTLLHMRLDHSAAQLTTVF